MSATIFFISSSGIQLQSELVVWHFRRHAPYRLRVWINAFCSFERDTFFAFRSFPSQEVATGTLQPKLIHLRIQINRNGLSRFV
ncbi:hypothetical protein [Rhizobium laguerreae]|uniref:hypothetical protein n=1 Tax=Rhizobium laguerreae TaxID=1076926 RepID=UPI001440F5D6|nr:hypothetical protein [Rhizobium laguerreae]MBY3167837.1 hypothetical protein [Rhizobium laguerreae]MBY3384000.1 hypothetical protein [Rhizobium laguerreae]NKM36285.1 hypothetical protein [Rhizobium laguerreae]